MLVKSLNLSYEIIAELNLIKMDHKYCGNWCCSACGILALSFNQSIHFLICWNKLCLHLVVCIYIPLVLAIHFKYTSISSGGTSPSLSSHCKTPLEVRLSPNFLVLILSLAEESKSWTSLAVLAMLLIIQAVDVSLKSHPSWHHPIISALCHFGVHGLVCIGIHVEILNFPCEFDPLFSSFHYMSRAWESICESCLTWVWELLSVKWELIFLKLRCFQNTPRKCEPKSLLDSC